MPSLSSWFRQYAYLRQLSNWHKHPWISKLMCAMGRHDFEVSQLGARWVLLHCFYCGRCKRSYY